VIALRTERGRLTGSVVDFFGGLEDLRRKLLRGVGEPEDRFREDPLRLLRAIRQKNERRGYSIEKKRGRHPPRGSEIFRSIPGSASSGNCSSPCRRTRKTHRDLRLAGILAILLPRSPSAIGGWARKSAAGTRSEIPWPAHAGTRCSPTCSWMRLRKNARPGCGKPFEGPPKRDARACERGRKRDLPALRTGDRRLHFPRIRGVVRMLEDLARLAHADRAKPARANRGDLRKVGNTGRAIVAVRADYQNVGQRKANSADPPRAVRQPPILSGKDLAAGFRHPRMEEILEEVRKPRSPGG
jgi:hypothetical protein